MQHVNNDFVHFLTTNIYMHENLTLVTSLALILISAGIITLIFKWLKQPLVLGYIVAGFLVGPHLNLFPGVIDHAMVEEWSQLGIIFLLFALGLEFSFKKLAKVGSTAFITAITEILIMGSVGFLVGHFLGWTNMESLFLGGMLAMSSTTIIIKAFDDLGVSKQKFAEIVLVVLIIEDLIAILMMVLLSTVAVSQKFAGQEILFSLLKVTFFLILWFLVGMYILPTFFKKLKNIMNEETLLIISLGLCFGMVVIADSVGISSALGAFVIGSLLGETIEGERIGKLTKGIKDLFGAVFFVSVGMLVDPAILAEYWLPIVIITFVTMFGKAIASASGVLLSGQSLKISIQTGFSLAQIGEFAFIIAALGSSLNVLSPFIYPIIVTVSVITTFTTPYFIRFSAPFADWAEKHLPKKLRKTLDRHTAGNNVVNTESDWKKLLKNYFSRILIFLVLLVAILIVSFQWFYPFMQEYFSGNVANILYALISILSMSPFIAGLITGRRSQRELISKLWKDKHRFNRGRLSALVLFRTFLAVFFITLILFKAFAFTVWIGVAIALAILFFLLLSRHSFKQINRMEKRFMHNLNAKEVEEESNKEEHYIASQLAETNVHLVEVKISSHAPFIGKTLEDIAFPENYGITIIQIKRGKREIDLPIGSDVVYPSDRLLILGADDEINSFTLFLEQHESLPPNERKKMDLFSFEIEADSPFVGKILGESKIRKKTDSMVIGIDKGDGKLLTPDNSTVFDIGDLVWLVGEKQNVMKLLEKKNEDG